MKHIETLIYYDGPRLYTAQDLDGSLVLVLSCDIDTLLICSTTDEVIRALKAKQITILDAIRQPKVRMVKYGFSGTPESFRVLDWDDVPVDNLPEIGEYI